MHRISDFQIRQVAFHGFRNCIHPADHFDGMAHDVDQAATLDAGAIFFVDEHHAHVDPNLGPGSQAHEVHMDRHIGHWMDLNIAGQHANFLATDV